MILATTETIPGQSIQEVKGVVFGDVVLGANFIKDFFGRLTDTIGGRSRGYESVFRDGRVMATDLMVKSAEKLGADAIVGIDFKFQTMGTNNTILQVSVHGTAVKLQRTK